ncbi:MAG TPA: F0F1 ATP synthase subunit alpha, partial [Propionicimonas sp.]|nr:F0F1 ATP synthase subunit alpha [Propionicimonas sp.]
KVSGTLKIGLAQYRDMEAFAMFASDLDATSRRQLDRGARLVELLRQPQYSPYPVAEQVISVWCGTTGKFDQVPVSEVLHFEREFLDYLRHNTKVLDTIAETGEFTGDSEQATLEALAKFRDSFVSAGGHPLAEGDQVAKPIPEAELDHEQIVVKKKRS